MTREEQETTIVYDRASDEATVYTSDPVMMRKMDKLLDSGASVVLIREDTFSRTYGKLFSLLRKHRPDVFVRERGFTRFARETQSIFKVVLKGAVVIDLLEGRQKRNF